MWKVVTATELNCWKGGKKFRKTKRREDAGMKRRFCGWIWACFVEVAAIQTRQQKLHYAGPAATRQESLPTTEDHCLPAGAHPCCSETIAIREMKKIEYIEIRSSCEELISRLFPDQHRPFPTPSCCPKWNWQSNLQIWVESCGVRRHRCGKKNQEVADWRRK